VLEVTRGTIHAGLTGKRRQCQSLRGKCDCHKYAYQAKDQFFHGVSFIVEKIELIRVIQPKWRSFEPVENKNRTGPGLTQSHTCRAYPTCVRNIPFVTAPNENGKSNPDDP
jgi:hypothetical protein